MFKHNWAWIKLATYNSSTVLTRNLRNPRDYAPLTLSDFKASSLLDETEISGCNFAVVGAIRCHRMGESTINTCLCDLFCVGVSHSLPIAPCGVIA